MTASFVIPSSLMLSLFLFGGAVHCLELRVLPHLDIWILCSDAGVKDFNLDSAGILKSYFTDLLPSAAVITIDGGDPDFSYCNIVDNRTSVLITSFGSAEFETENVISRADIQSLVTAEALEAYFQNKVCEERIDLFDAAIEGEASNIRKACNPLGSFSKAVKDFQRGVIVIIVISVIVVLCIIACLCACRRG
jgi:hypothetical protein